MNELDSAAVAAIFVQQISSVSFDIGHHYTKPSVLYRPTLSVDGNQYCALLGQDLQSGVAGFGDTAEAAMADFDKAFKTPLRNSPSGLASA